MTDPGQPGQATIRRDQGSDRARAQTRPQGPRWSSPRLRRFLPCLFLLLAVVFSAIPIAIDLLDKPNKDYSLWYQVGQAVRMGLDIYPDPATGRLFPFMYPPSAAAILAFISPLGKHGMTLLLVLAHSVAWAGAILLSVWLATGGKIRGQNPLLYVAPSLCIIALVHNTYLLGQPNLSLLSLLLLAFVFLRWGWQVPAGALVATAAAIKAFPILALGYLLYRRMWRAAIATVVVLLLWLLVAPLPFRTPSQAIADLAVWSRGMVFTYNPQGIAQRPYRSFSYKNQSIMAVLHRLLRDVPADGERVLSELAEAGPKTEPPRGMLPNRSIDLVAMLTAPAETPRWNAQNESIEPAMKRAWRVNVVALDFRWVTLITLAAMQALCLFTALVLPPRAARTARTDALEFALVTLLIVMFSPLSFNYAYVWLIYPMTVGLNLVLNEPLDPLWRKAAIVWISLVLAIPATAVFMPLYAQAYGNLFIPALLLVLGLGLACHRESGVSPRSVPAMHPSEQRAVGSR